jgi:hypothetical protein
MNFSGSYQVGLGSKLLRQYEWWKFEPHPDWVTPRGTTLLEPVKDINEYDWGMDFSDDSFFSDDFAQPLDGVFPAGQWKAHEGNFRLPYAAGIPGKARFIYIPCFGLNCFTPPTVLGLESAVQYHAYYWEPSLGIKIDLGIVARPSPGATIREDKFDDRTTSEWTDYGSKTTRTNGRLSASGNTLSVIDGVDQTNLVASVNAHANANAGLLLRFHDPDNYLAALYSANDKTIYLFDRQKGQDGKTIRKVPIKEIGSDIRLEAEVRDGWAATSITDGQRTYCTGIVRVRNVNAGTVGLIHKDDGSAQMFSNFEVQNSPTLGKDEHLVTKLYDARGVYRGEMKGPGLGPDAGPLAGGWSDFAKNKLLLLDAYRPPRLPTAGDWVLVLENQR